MTFILLLMYLLATENSQLLAAFQDANIITWSQRHWGKQLSFAVLLQLATPLDFFLSPSEDKHIALLFIMSDS